MNTPMSQAEYKRLNGNNCPACKEGEVDASYPEPHEHGITISCTCERCHSTWVENYCLDGYVELNAEENR